MARTELPWLLWGRYVRPFPLAASVACALMSANIYTGSSVWRGTDDVLTAATAAGGIIAALLLWAAWWGRSSVLMEHGLALTAVLFAMRAATIWMEGNPLTAGLSFAWTIAAAGGWLLQRSTGHLDPDAPDGGGPRE